MAAICFINSLKSLHAFRWIVNQRDKCADFLIANFVGVRVVTSDDNRCVNGALVSFKTSIYHDVVTA